MTRQTYTICIWLASKIDYPVGIANITSTVSICLSNCNYFIFSLFFPAVIMKIFDPSKSNTSLHKHDFFSKCVQIRSFLWIWSRFTKEIYNRKLSFLCSAVNDDNYCKYGNSQKYYDVSNMRSSDKM